MSHSLLSFGTNVLYIPVKFQSISQSMEVTDFGDLELLHDSLGGQYNFLHV